MSENEFLLKVDQIYLAHGDHQVLENVSFSMTKGEFVYLIGQTGSGKSSLLKSIYADLKLQSGTINYLDFQIDQIQPSRVPFLRRNIGIVFQDFQLLSDRTVHENLSFVLKATGWNDSAKIKNRISESLMRVGLGSSDHKYPHQLSGGEQQRTVIARALLNEPSLLIADEPTGNLDPIVADEIHQLFKKINLNGTAVLMATHNHQLIQKYPFRTLECTNQGIKEIEIA